MSQSPLLKDLLQSLWCKCRHCRPFDDLCQEFAEVQEWAVWIKDVKFNEGLCIASKSIKYEGLEDSASW